MLWIFITLGVLILFTMVAYNRFIRLRNQADQAFSTIDVMAKKRYDLIPNLVAAVEKYMQHERGTLIEITEMRAKAMQGNLSPNDRVDLENKITRTLGNIQVAVENYPELKASENFQQLQGSLNEVEEQLSAARRAYNASVTEYNNSVQLFPSNVFAMVFNFRSRKWLETPEEERKNVDVKKLFNS
ncbi:MAG: LemA family protein [Bacteroidales bacterium]|jgi:LemA protein|nr:LemA family protein [Bacteroidales bacterium]NLM93483.1 LemA family protein [Bacteroidales bacterium]